MKKPSNLALVIIFVTQLFLYTNTAFSQSESTFDLGASVGVLNTFSTFNTDLASDSDALASFSFGVILFYDLSDRLQIKSGIPLEQYSFEIIDFSPLFPSDFIDGMSDVNRSFRSSNISTSFLIIPVEIRYKLIGGINHLYATGGVRPKFLLDDNSNHSITSGTDEIESSLLGINSFILDLSFGLGYEFKLGAQKIYVEAKSFIGLNDFESFEGDTFANGRLNGLGLFAGIRL